MRFRRSAPAVIIGTLAVVLAAMTWVGNALFSAQVGQVEDRQFALMRAILESGLRGAEDRALARADMVASLPSVRKAFAAGDRPALLAELESLYATQRDKYGVDQAQFVDPKNISFLRLNAPNRIGDDLAKIRPIIVAVNADRVVRKGMALGRSGPALVGVVPVYDQENKHLGVFEMGMDFGVLLDKMKADYGLEGSFFVKEKPLREIATGVSPEVLDEHNRNGEFLRYSATNAALARQTVDGSDLARVNGDPVQYTREANGVTYGVVLSSLRNAAGEALGIVALSQDFSSTRSAAGQALVQQLALAAAALVVLAGVVLVSIRGLLLRPLDAINRGYRQLDDGSAPDPAADPGAGPLCEELTDLAARYRRDCAAATQRTSS